MTNKSKILRLLENHYIFVFENVKTAVKRTISPQIRLFALGFFVALNVFDDYRLCDEACAVHSFHAAEA